MTTIRGRPHPALYTALGDPSPPAEGFAFYLLPRHGARPVGFFGRLLFTCADTGAPSDAADIRAPSDGADTRAPSDGADTRAPSDGADTRAGIQRHTSHLAVHEIAGGGFCAAIHHQDTGSGIQGWRTALAAPDAAALADLLQSHKPITVPLRADAPHPGAQDGVARSWAGILALVCRHAG